MISIRTLLLAATISLPLVAQTPTPPQKQPIHGLVTMGSLKFLRHGGTPGGATVEANAHPGVYSAVVINVLWSDLEPQRGTFDHASIERGLAAIRSYNKSHPKTPLVGKLRIFSGTKSPGWAMQIGGPRIKVYDKEGDALVPHMWLPEYRAAWKELQDNIAATYDADPMVAEVAMTSCSTVTDEPFILAAGLDAGGMTDADFHGCLMTEWNDYTAWKLTPLDYTVNPSRIHQDGKIVQSPEFTVAVMRAFRKALGPRAVIGNHGLNMPLKPAAEFLYGELKSEGGAIEFQTVSPQVDWDAAMANGFTFKPTEIEIWNTRADDGLANISQAQLERWANAMR